MNALDAEPVPSGTPPLDAKAALRQSIERDEGELRDAVEELTAAVKHEITLGGQIAERPAMWLTAGVVIGVLMAW